MNSHIKVILVSILLLALLSSPVVRSGAAGPMAGITYTVSSLSDLPDAQPGDGLCEATAGVGDCTLRAATMEANADADPGITLMVPAGLYRLTIPAVNPEDAAHGSIKITRSMTIIGAGAAQTTIDGDRNHNHDRTFEVLSNADNAAITIQGLTIQEGGAADSQPIGARGGGLYAKLGDETGASGSLTLQDTLFKLNLAQGAAAGGGGIYLEGWSESTFTLSNVTLSNNEADSDSYAGAGLQFESGDYSLGRPYSSLLVQDSYIANNTAAPFTNGIPWGGGIEIRHGKVSLIGSTLTNNLSGVGGGISLDGANSTLDLVNSTLSSNQANLNGGGIYAVNGSASLSNVTVITNNSDADLDGSGLGGGIYQAGPASVSLANSLVVYNHESTFDPDQQAYILVHGDLRGAYTSGGYNGFVDTLDSTFTGQHALDRYDITYELIGPLAYNGGATPTRALLTGSEAIDNGNPAGCTSPVGSPLATDQRGYSRTIAGICDIGAYEFNPNIYLGLVLR